MGQKKKPKTTQAARTDFYSEHIKGRLLTIGAVLGVGTLVVLYFLGVLPEGLAGLLLAASIIVVACGFAAYELLTSTSSNTMLALGIVLTVCTACLAIYPVVTTLMPGRPFVQTSIQSTGQTIPLPSDVMGPVRMFLHGDLGLSKHTTVDVTLDLGDERLAGHLDRVQRMARVGRSGTAAVIDEHNSQFISGVIHKGVRAITVSDYRGEIPGGVQLSIYRERFPFLFELAAAAILVLMVALTAAYLRANASVAALIASALAFGLCIYRMATPDGAIRSMIWALLVGAIIGTASGGTVGWLVKKIVGGPKAPCQRAGASART